MFSLLPFLAWGQSDNGTVRDTSAATVAHVKITVTDARTDTDVFNTTTDAAGRYTAPALKPSDYTVTAEMPGFKKDVRRGITPEVNQVAAVDLVLQVGQVTEVLEVTEAAPLMHAQSAELGDVVEHRRVVELPLNGRSVSPRRRQSAILGATPVDAIQEFKVQTSNQESEFGKNTAATVNVVIRSGTEPMSCTATRTSGRSGLRRECHR